MLLHCVFDGEQRFPCHAPCQQASPPEQSKRGKVCPVKLTKVSLSYRNLGYGAGGQTLPYLRQEVVEQFLWLGLAKFLQHILDEWLAQKRVGP